MLARLSIASALLARPRLILIDDFAPDATPIPQHSCWRCSKAWRVTARA